MYKNLLTIAALLITGFSFSQGSYSFNVSNQTYENLENATSLNDGEVWDDPEFLIPIGFEFQISSQTFNSIYIVAWGVGGELSPSQTDSGVLSILSPIAQDIIDRGFVNEVSESNISYTTEGTSGNRILKIEWNNVGFFDDATENDFMNFQVWLYEDTNTIEYRYGPNEIANPSDSYEGETGPIVSLQPSVDLDEGPLEEAYILSGNPANPVYNVVSPGEEYDGDVLEGTIPNGTVYSFIPATLSSEEFEAATVVLYPNPVSDILSVRGNSTGSKLSLYNSLGQKLPMVELGNGSYDVSALSSGLYLLEIRTATGTSIKRIVKN
ncbi:T9SS type A sorting domain-containing protein [Cochleicola gelatinilyticus]|uniref:Secretion system C-terminal sorting domain-containing protein n=1 Tax=Cochleicola gelatinilyticus TaxID=1763537 RepID=A0A167IET9_9FLAO|nr:T9SS type A sorting domain-containing protein [Cochleicola gelatinilyticus]OAB79580.1 hypothetical protein ULVI_02170 [Cochleicola gelatinilyticus]